MRLQHHGGTVVLKTSTHSILPATPQPPHVGCLPHRKNYAIKKIPQSVARALPASLTAITVRDVIDYTHTAAGRARRGQVVSSVVRYPRYLDTYRRYLRDDTSIANVTIYRGLS